ncbi:uncharacterized protein [Rutidosis leptorrhynchoides]|uniref:uncharacterized protein n=1 Tax=Rutidosis leptorrhynchoides TaxID=125765 RepID=UPI003A9941E5
MANGVKIRRHAISNFYMHLNFVSNIEPTNVEEAFKDSSWVGAMQDELTQFDRNKVWKLVSKPEHKEKKVIGTKWVFKNKMDEDGVVIKNNAKLVAQSFRQEQGLDYGETYAPVAGMEGIRIFLASAAHMNFRVFQKDVKSAYLNGSNQNILVQIFQNLRCKIDRKSTTSGYQLLGGRLVSWTNKKQNTVSISTAEAEYVSAGSCTAQELWMQNQLKDYGIHFTKTPIYCDNTSAIAISITNNPVMHSRTKHINVRYHFIRDHVQKGDIKLHFNSTDQQLADLFTKPLDERCFNYLIYGLSMLEL